MSTVTIKSYFGDLETKAQKIIDQNKEPNSYPNIAMGIELRKVIENAKLCYEEFLDTSKDAFSTEITKKLDEVFLLPETIATQQDYRDKIKKLTEKAQVLLNTFPFHQERPLVRSFSPGFIFRKEDTSFPVSFLGNFVVSSEQDLQPSLHFKGKKIEVIPTVSAQKMVFTVLPSAVFDDLFNQAANKQEFTFSEGSLVIPWKQGTTKATAIFKITIGALPPYITGKASFFYKVINYYPEYSTKSDEKHIDSCRGRQYHVEGKYTGGFNNDEDKKFWIKPDPGWRFMPESRSSKVIHTEGDYNGPNFISADASMIMYQASTNHHGIGTSGELTFSISATQTRDVPKDDVQKVSQLVKWDQPLTYTLPENLQSNAPIEINLTTFDGSLFVWRNTEDSQHPYYQIQKSKKEIKITANIPGEMLNI